MNSKRRFSSRPTLLFFVLIALASAGCPAQQEMQVWMNRFQSFGKVATISTCEDKPLELDAWRSRYREYILCKDSDNISDRLSLTRRGFDENPSQAETVTLKTGPVATTFNTNLHVVNNKAFVTADVFRNGRWHGDLFSIQSDGMVREVTFGEGLEIDCTRKAGGLSCVQLVDQPGGRVFNWFEVDDMGTPTPIGQTVPGDEMGEVRYWRQGAPGIDVVDDGSGDLLLILSEKQGDMLYRTVVSSDGEPIHRLDSYPAGSGGYRASYKTDVVKNGNDVYGTYIADNERGETEAKAWYFKLDTQESGVRVLDTISSFEDKFLNGIGPNISVRVAPTLQYLGRRVPWQVMFMTFLTPQGLRAYLYDRYLESCLSFPIPVNAKSPLIAATGPTKRSSEDTADGEESVIDDMEFFLPINSIDVFQARFFSVLNFAQFADGGGLFSQLSLNNLDENEEARVRITFRDQEGQPLPFELTEDEITLPGNMFQGSAEITLPPGGSRKIRTDGTGDAISGSLTVQSNKPISGTTIFGGTVGLAGVPASQPLQEGFSAPVETDFEQAINTGIAVMNLEEEENTVTATLVDSDGSLVATADPIVVKGNGQVAQFLTEFSWDQAIDLSVFDGVLRVTTTGRTAATVLQVRPGQFATLPVTPR